MPMDTGPSARAAREVRLKRRAKRRVRTVNFMLHLRQSMVFAHTYPSTAPAGCRCGRSMSVREALRTSQEGYALPKARRYITLRCMSRDAPPSPWPAEGVVERLGRLRSVGETA